MRCLTLLVLLTAVGHCDLALGSRAFIGRDSERGTPTLQVVASAGERNDIVVTEASDAVAVSDEAGVEAGAGCRKLSTTEVECDQSGGFVARLLAGDLADRVLLRSLGLRWSVDMGDGPDVFEATGEISEVRGGEGDDVLVGPGAGLNTLSGEEGADDLRARGGATRLVGGPGDDRLQAPAKSRWEGTQLDGGPGGDVFLGGEDAPVSVTYSTRTAPVTVDLDGEADDGEAQEGDLVGPGIDEIHGGAGDDTITGGDAPDTLIGNGGSDALDGGGGSDVLQGWDGHDLLSGGNGADSLIAGLGADVLEGQGGDDTMSTGDESRGPGGWSGADRFSGGDGFDSVSYGGIGEGVSVDLEGDADDGPPGKGDTVLSDIEAVGGSIYDDRLTGSPGNDVFAPVYGRDVVDAGPGNDVVKVARGPFWSPGLRPPSPDPEAVVDMIDGGTGIDAVDYADAGPARVDLGGHGRNGSDTQPQELRGIENLVGSRFADGFITGPGPNTIVTGRGDDSVVVRPTDGDTIDCGAGSDAAEISPNTATTDCEWLQLQATGPSAFADVKPLRGEPDFVQLRVTFTESWVGASLRLTERSSGRRVSAWRVLPQTHRRQVRAGLALTRRARRLLRRRKTLTCILTIRSQDLAGRVRTDRRRVTVVLEP